jgi:hypothetical protein
MNVGANPHRLARMSQLDLFKPKAEPLPQRQPDLAYIRKSLNSHLRMARDAQILPWSEGETESLEKFFPQLAALLPAEEAEAMTSEFKSELARLRSAQ